MPRFTFHCWSCGEVAELDEVHRTDRCSKCGEDLKVCKTCRHFDERASNQCRETSADYVHEKGRANYCSYFSPREDRVEKPDEVADARAKLEALFKK